MQQDSIRAPTACIADRMAAFIASPQRGDGCVAIATSYKQGSGRVRWLILLVLRVPFRSLGLFITRTSLQRFCSE